MMDFYEAYKNNPEMIEFYEEYKDDPEMLVVRSNRKGYMDILEDIFLVRKELDILEASPKEKWNWLHRCNLLSPAPLPVVEFYIQHGVEVNAQDMYGMTPLHYAMRERNAEAAIALLNAGANPNIPDRDNLRPLSMIGYTPERLDILKMMLERGADVNNIINENETILESWKPNHNSPQHDIEIYNMMLEYK